MRETVAGYEGRTGRRYAPNALVRAQGRPLRADEGCPTLFRYPGPCGLRLWMHRDLARLGPPTVETLWLTARPLFADTVGASLFGTIVVLQPLAFHPCESERPGIYAAENRAVRRGEELAFVPPAALTVPLAWDEVRTAAEADELVRPYRDPLLPLRLTAYLEEMDALRQRGVCGPGLPWCEVPVEERRDLLARHGVEGRFTR